LYGISTVWGDQQLPLFILRTPPYLRKEVEIWHTGRHLRVLKLYVTNCVLGSVWEDQQPLIFILEPLSIMSETNQGRKLKFVVLAGIYRY